jgi:hypothetical protein
MSHPPPLPPKPGALQHHAIGDQVGGAKRVTASSSVVQALAAQAIKLQQHPASSLAAHRPPADPSSSSSPQCGIGIVLRASKKTPPDPFVKIESVATDGPACKSGVKCNDRIISVDDVDMRDATIDRVQEAVKGAPGSTVKIEVARGGQILPFVITRVALKPRGDGRLEPEKEATTPTSAKAAASPRGGDHDAAAAASDAADRRFPGRKKSVIESMKDFFSPRAEDSAAQEVDESHMSIGAPFGFKQLVHVTVDPTSASGFNGLPDVWEKSLMQSKISKEEIMENPDAMLEVLKFACDDNAQVPLPRHSVAVMQLSAGVQFKSSDPTSEYGKLTQQLGKGGAGTIFMGTKKREPFAIKVLPISRDTDMAALTTEIAIMSSTKHPCCVQYCPQPSQQKQI